MDADNTDDLDSAKFQERCQFPAATQGIGKLGYDKFISDIMMVGHNLTLQPAVCGVRFGYMPHSILRAKLQIIFRIIIILRQYN